MVGRAPTRQLTATKVYYDIDSYGGQSGAPVTQSATESESRWLFMPTGGRLRTPAPESHLLYSELPTLEGTVSGMAWLNRVVRTRSGEPVSKAVVTFGSAPTAVPEIGLARTEDGGSVERAGPQEFMCLARITRRQAPGRRL